MRRYTAPRAADSIAWRRVAVRSCNLCDGCSDMGMRALTIRSISVNRFFIAVAIALLINLMAGAALYAAEAKDEHHATKQIERVPVTQDLL
jgi:hypothetical protein